ncbi:conserved hypothetical protein [Leishmania infantum JPCM5]|uniref:Uncharacterized protein n=2 Tax=Leishmania infantum TaxID=5671 RepID=A4IBV2_LEIIN|nr:conserved hypothetical protein [Leishmania infantum JPCM5]CAC9546610.1 hypothetical_protein_-_conserved [Leishmania infantum]CAM72324.1 conserved hypothetical protein [Leishmania infantum JPCM5]SUZ46243.1 hypothetical_protein_-_conserved [Leishmania infantum]|eukprot:XP_001469221.1 conserved hypothetical protein [Leishmania infantum JPCM5]
MSAAAAPALKLRSRSVNTTQGSVPGAKPVPSRSSKARTRSTRVTPTPFSEVQPRGAATTPSSSVTRRTIRTGQPITQDRPPVTVVGESKPQACSGAKGFPSSLPTSTSHVGNGVRAPLLTAGLSEMSANYAKFSSGAAIATPQMGLHNSSASRVDSTCSSLRGSSDKGSADRRQRPPQVPRVSQLSSNAPVTRFATMETPLPLRRTATAANIIPTASAPGSQFCSRTPSMHEMAAPLSPRRVPPSARPYASAPASRVSSVNSRLAEGAARLVRRPPQRLHTSSTRLFVVKRSSSAATTAASTTTPSPTAPSSYAVVATADGAGNTPSTALGAPSRSMGTRPLLGTSCTSTPKSGGANGAPRLRALHPSTQPALCVDRGPRSARGGASNGNNSFSASCTATRGTSRQAPARQQQHQKPLSARCAAGGSMSRKATRKLGGDGAPVAISRAPPAPFQQTHTGCPPLLSFASCVKGSAASAVPKGPVSPIKRTSTACPSAAQRYPVPSADNLARVSEGRASSINDAAFASPWIRPGMLSSPTNGGGGRDASEAPTIPYEGSTGQRGSMSLSPRTDFDTLSVSGRLSYGI